MHIVELRKAAKVDIKVINASLTRNQCNISQLCGATELNNDGTIKFFDVHYQTELNLSIFPKEI